MTSSWDFSTNEKQSDSWWRCGSGWRRSRYHCIRKRPGSSSSVASRRKIERVAALVNRRRSTSLGSLTSAAGFAGVSTSLNGRQAGTGREQGCESSKKSCSGACTNQSRFRVSVWDRSSADTSHITRYRPSVDASEPSGTMWLISRGARLRGAVSGITLLGTEWLDSQQSSCPTSHSSSVAKRSLRRKTPKV